ncbi:hypothetical protein ncot_16265 [Nocardioides sp. JQ2195]|uniref:hypothetical protein n=1 Tax=Nocardioides sp. JQ2195 TaxID=2592334 RepID=UPI00143EC1E1|nr:hypothetical protein [Nocardioides sp. JQ2195]QIX27971.1 hypothetical protein ncot_16265 [Nocardioides sp. JQ2195]
MLRTSTLAVLTLVAAGLSTSPAHADRTSADRGGADRSDDVVSAAGQHLDGQVVDRVADTVDQTIPELTELLESDSTARVRNGRLLHQDTFEQAESTVSEHVARASAPLSQTFELHSRPGGKRTIYLDFNGERVCDSGWTGPGDCIKAPAFDTDGRSGFSSGELRAIQSAWKRAAEDYAPFAVDVTTERPSAGDITRSGSGDKRFGVRAVITSSNSVRKRVCGGPGCGGVAFVDIFDRSRANRLRDFWVFPREVNNQPRRIADVVSHEAGHTLGLSHDGTRRSPYASGHGIWAPLMGSSNRQLTQWSRGEYAHADNRENDLSVIASNGAPRVRDDHGGRSGSATRLRAGQAARGVISRGSDTDVFRIRTTCRAKLTVRARNAGESPNLDIRLTLTNRAGRVLARRNPLSSASGEARGLDATYAGKRRAGVYFVRIDGVGARDPRTTGYSDYASLGSYRVTLDSRCGG